MAFDLKKLTSMVAKATSTKGGNYVQPGKGVLVLKKVVHTDGHKGPHFIIEATVESSIKTDPNFEPNPPGADVSLVYPLTGDKAAISANSIRNYCEALEGKEGLSNDEIATLIDPENNETLKGVKFGYSAVQKIGQKTGKPYTQVTFSHIG